MAIEIDRPQLEAVGRFPLGHDLMQSLDERASEAAAAAQRRRHGTADADAAGEQVPACQSLGLAPLRRFSTAAPSAASSGATASKCHSETASLHGVHRVGADAQRADTKAIARVAVEVDLDIQRRQHVFALLDEAIEGDRQPKPMTDRQDVAFVER